MPWTIPKPANGALARRILSVQHAAFSTTRPLDRIEDMISLPDRVLPRYEAARPSDLLNLRWPRAPQNILLVRKKGAPAVTHSLVEFANYITSTYSPLSVLLERDTASDIHNSLHYPVYTNLSTSTIPPEKVDLTVTLGGDGTILRASSFFATSKVVPPILSFSMGTLGFLGEWKFSEYKRAFREVYMSGSPPMEAKNGTPAEEPGRGERQTPGTDGGNAEGGLPPQLTTTSPGVRLDKSPCAKILVRNRIKVGLFTPDGMPVPKVPGGSDSDGVHAMNEVVIHRGLQPHLAMVEVFVSGRYLTEAVADGMIVSTPTGSTAYSLSCGGSIIHPLVSSLLLTPICPRSLSFRPLVIPSSTAVTLRLSEKNRGREVEVSIDGVRMGQGLSVGMEVRVTGEKIERIGGHWLGGIPCVMRKTVGEGDAADGWVGGLNGLLKFNYPFGA